MSCPWEKWAAAARAHIVDADKPRVGDVRMIGGVPSLIFRDSEDGFTACPVKPIREDGDDDKVTGKVVFVEICPREMWRDDAIFNSICLPPNETMGMALPEFGAHVYQEYVGELLYRVFPAQAEKAMRCWMKLFADNDETFDIAHPNSEEDWGLYRKMARESMRKLFVYEADTWVFGKDGSTRPETEKERKLRIRKYERKRAKAKRKAEKEAERAARQLRRSARKKA